MTTIKNTLTQIKTAEEEIGRIVCDKLKGDCNKCPFKNKCVAELLVEIQLGLESIELDLTKLLK